MKRLINDIHELYQNAGEALKINLHKFNKLLQDAQLIINLGQYPSPKAIDWN
jgi:hypothetical protein